jgi:HAMP domain-containing protein
MASAIWGFTRMAPAVDTILKENQVSIQACQRMLTALAHLTPRAENIGELKQHFEKALYTAENNITEEREKEHISKIKVLHQTVFAQYPSLPAPQSFSVLRARQKLINHIDELTSINNEAMENQSHRAKHLGYGSAWLMVFLGVISFWMGLILNTRISKNLIGPLEEIHQVIRDFKAGNSIRRCDRTGMPPYVRNVLSEVNSLLDRK